MVSSGKLKVDNFFQRWLAEARRKLQLSRSKEGVLLISN
jgi:hypothetical protein